MVALGTDPVLISKRSLADGLVKLYLGVGPAAAILVPAAVLFSLLVVFVSFDGLVGAVSLLEGVGAAEEVLVPY